MAGVRSVPVCAHCRVKSVPVCWILEEAVFSPELVVGFGKLCSSCLRRPSAHGGTAIPVWGLVGVHGVGIILTWGSPTSNLRAWSGLRI